MSEHAISDTQRKALEGFVHPAVFESPESEFGYYGIGTIFTVKFKGSYYAITAKHIINKPWNSSADLRILLRHHEHTVPFDRESAFPDDDDMTNDILIFRIDTQRLELNPPPNLQFMNLDSFSVPDHQNLNDLLFLVCGYPGCRRSYDYDNKKVVAGITIIEGNHVETSLQNEVSAIKVNYDHINEPNGLSGSPVMLISSGVPLLAGMVLRSTPKSRLIHFMSAKAILRALNTVHTKEIELQELK